MGRLNRRETRQIPHPHCQGRRCIREINPDQFPGHFRGKQFDYDLNDGECVQCDFELKVREEENSKKDNEKPIVRIRLRE